jgi:hypothetical protein
MLTHSWFVTGFILFCVVLIVGRIVLSVVEGVLNLCQLVRRAEARVVAKRSEVHGPAHGRTSTTYYTTFEFADGSRREFSLSGTEYGLLVEGDAGGLSWQGTAYRGFERRSGREKYPLESQVEL